MTRLLMLLPFLALACDATVAGKNDVLRFRYDADDNVLPSAFNTPIGAGLAARVEVFVDTGSSTSNTVEAPVLDASSSDAAVATVVATAGNTLTLLAHAPGTSEVRVQTTRGDDVFDVRVVAVTKIDLQHPGVLVSDNPPSKGIVGGTARFIVALKSAAGESAVGFGQLDVTVAPTGACQLLDSEDIGFAPVRFGVAGTATLTSLGDGPLTVDIVADADVTELDMVGPGAVNELVAGRELAAILRGVTATGEKVVGVASLATVASSDPTVCTITPNEKLGEGAYLIVAKAAGSCRVSATLGARAVQHDITVKAK